MSVSTLPGFSLSGKHGVGRIDIVENRFIGMKSRGKELKIIFIFICLVMTFFYLCQISLTGFLTYTNGDIHCKCREMDIFALNFTFIQKLSFQYPGLSCNLQLFYMSALSDTLAIPLP